MKEINFYESASIEEIPPLAGYKWFKSINLLDDLGTISQTNTLPDGVTTIGANYFKSTAIETLTMPNVTSIGENAFRDCDCLKSVTISQDAIIGAFAFSYINSTSTCTIRYNGPMSKWHFDYYSYSPNLVVECNDDCSCGWCGDAVEDASSLYWKQTGKDLTIDCINDAAYQNPKATQVIRTHNWSNQISTLTLNRVDTIAKGEFAFYTKLKRVYINPTLKSIETGAFSGCPYLTHICFDGTEVQWNNVLKKDGWDDGIPSNYSLHFACQVTFDANGHGTAPEAQNPWFNKSMVIKPADPSADHYFFFGWYTDAGCTKKWGINTDLVFDDMTLYAKWKEVCWSGDGSENNPYMIYTTTDLDKLAEFVNDGMDYSGQYFKLANDLTYTRTTAWNDATSTENNYTAIGNEVCQFRGTFDGDGHTISGIRIYKGGNIKLFDTFQGLFGCVGKFGVVKNIILTDARITGWAYVSGIVGKSSHGCIMGCHVAADVALYAVQNNADSFGGIVGFNYKSTVSGCTSAVKIAVRDGLSNCVRFGGIVGYNFCEKDNNFNGTITGCQAIGASVAAFEDSGAIVGYYYVVGTSDNPLNGSGNSYHSCLVGANAFNIGVGEYEIDKNSNFFGDVTGASLDATALRLDDRIDNTALIAAYAAPSSHTADSGTAPDVSNLSVTLHDRTLWKDMAWNTICLPFSMTAEQVTAQLAPAALKELDITGTYEGKQTGLDGTTLYLYFRDATSIEAGKPYIIKWDGDGTNNLVNPVFSGVTISSTTPTEVTFTGGKFVGSYSPVDFAANDKSILYLGDKNKLYWPNAAMTLGAFRAHFELTDGTNASELVLNFDDDATSIKSLTPDPSPTGEGSDYWYTLSGTHLSTQPTKPGLYIHNGRKVVIK